MLLLHLRRQFVRYFADKTFKTPYMADSITQEVGEYVKQDETVANIETDKVTIPVNSPEAGQLKKIFAKEGETVEVGSDLFIIDTDALIKEAPKPKEPESKPKEPIKVVEEVAKSVVDKEKKPKEIANVKTVMTDAKQRIERMSRMRVRIAQRMKESQETAASLTTFNEVDMSRLMALRSLYKEKFAAKHGGTKLGFMSAFVRATTIALQEQPILNAQLRMDEEQIIYNDNIDISIAVATPKGLVTPVLRDCQNFRTFGQIEQAIEELGERARQQKISIEELAGGTFTISNGGVFGSLMGTPIINQPQSAILGMHAIKERPIVIDGKIEIRPMMYLALTYDHRLIDGREAVTFLVRIKELVEDPQRMLLEV